MRQPDLWGADELDMSMPTLPPRSRLLHLPPKALRTGRAEGLLSYIIRLAGAHCVSPRRLVKTEFVAANPSMARCLDNRFFARDMGTVNGIGAYARMFSDVVTGLTGTTETQRMTLRPLAGLLPIPGQGLTARQRQWCPDCWREMLERGLEPYSPLAWSFALYRVCGRHGRALVSRCPHCQRSQPFMPRIPDQTVCDHCQCSLIEAAVHTLGNDMDGKTTGLERWLAEAVEDLVRHLGELTGPDLYRRTLDFLKQAADTLTDGNLAQLCARIGLQRDAIRPWFGKSVRPSLPMFLSVCYGLDVAPAKVLLGFAVPGPKALLTLPGVITARGVRPMLTEAQRQELRPLIEAVAQNDGDRRPAAVVARQFGMERSCFKYWFPDLHEFIAAKHAVGRMSRGEQRYAQHRQCMESVVNGMVDQGDYPARRRVDLALRAQGITLKAPELRQDYQAYIRSQILNWGMGADLEI